MRYLKLFEDFKVNNISEEDIINCIKKGGNLYSNIVKNLPNVNEDPLRPVSIDEDGLITIEYDGNEYEVNLRDVKKIEY